MVAALCDHLLAGSVLLFTVLVLLVDALYQAAVFWPQYGAARPLLSALSLADFSLALYIIWHFSKVALFFIFQTNLFGYVVVAQQRRNNARL